MKNHRIVALIFSLAFVNSATADVDLSNGSVAHFASVSEGAEILGRKDDFIQRLSGFDRSARLKTDRSISEDEFLKFVKANVVTWTEPEKTAVEAAIAHIRPGLQTLSLSLPKTIYFVKTTGAEEGKAFYTRNTAIILPGNELDGAGPKLLEKTIAHELFHILSRENPTLREKLYQLIGFSKCPEVALPVELRDRKITNPDAPRNDHSIRLRVGDREVVGVPILFSDSEKYNAGRGDEFFNYLQFKFLVVPKNGKGSGGAELVALERASGLFEQVGRNTDYVIHPEEILADNFALLVLDEQNVPSPEILQRMRATLVQR
jgi:hypothetical protein